MAPLRRLAHSARALRVMRPRDWIAAAGVSLAGALIAATVLVAVVNGALADERAARLLEAQAEQAMDARAAQTQRIDGLSAQLDALRDEMAAQEGTIAAQSQAIDDLSVQLRRAGTDPITGDPAANAPTSTGSQLEFAPPAPSPVAPTPQQPAEPAPEPAQPKPAPGTTPVPAPAPVPNEPLCLPLDLLCLG